MVARTEMPSATTCTDGAYPGRYAPRAVEPGALLEMERVLGKRKRPKSLAQTQILMGANTNDLLHLEH